MLKKLRLHATRGSVSEATNAAPLPPGTLQKGDFPLIQQAAGANSQEGQQRYFRDTRRNLIMLIVATVAGAFTLRRGTTDWAGVIATIAFLGALYTRLNLLTGRPERTWYDGRAAAESAKTLAWRYAVGGKPFGIKTCPSQQADALLLTRLSDILTNLGGLGAVPPARGGEQITAGMRALRSRSLEERKAAYAAGRIANQRDWYSSKARWNLNRAQRWGAALLLVEFAGAVGAIVKAIGLVEIDLLGLAGTAAAAGTSWLQAKQHTTLAEAYSVTAHELAAIAAQIDMQQSEETWAEFVDDAEEAISREHTLWRASRGAKSCD